MSYDFIDHVMCKGKKNDFGPTFYIKLGASQL